jgi:hypothetical protein
MGRSLYRQHVFASYDAGSKSILRMGDGLVAASAVMAG